MDNKELKKEINKYEEYCDYHLDDFKKIDDKIRDTMTDEQKDLLVSFQIIYRKRCESRQRLYDLQDFLDPEASYGWFKYILELEDQL